MSLAAVVTQETHDALPAELQEHYSPSAEDATQHVLQVDPSAGLELVDPANLKRALQTERGSVATLTKQLKTFEGIEDPAAALAALAKIEELGDRIDKLDDPALKKELEDHKASLVAKFESDKKQLTDKHQLELDKLTGTNKTLHTQLTDNLVSSAAVAAIASEKGSVDLLLPVVKARMKMKETDDGRLKVVIVDSDGTERISPKSGSTDPMTVAELVVEMKTDTKFQRAFDGSGSTGSGASGSGGGTTGTGSVISISAADAKDPAKYRTAKALAEKQGKQLSIAE